MFLIVACLRRLGLEYPREWILLNYLGVAARTLSVNRTADSNEIHHWQHLKEFGVAVVNTIRHLACNKRVKGGGATHFRNIGDDGDPRSFVMYLALVARPSRTELLPIPAVAGPCFRRYEE